MPSPRPREEAWGSLQLTPVAPVPVAKVDVLALGAAPVAVLPLLRAPVDAADWGTHRRRCLSLSRTLYRPAASRKASEGAAATGRAATVEEGVAGSAAMGAAAVGAAAMGSAFAGAATVGTAATPNGGRLECPD